MISLIQRIFGCRCEGIWLTRPKADSRAMARQLRTRGVASCVAPMMEIVPEWQMFRIDPKRSPAGILLTSKHAAHMLGLYPRQLNTPIYCVGEATAAMARRWNRRNDTPIIVGEGDILALLPRIAEDLKDKTLLYFSGEDTSVDVESLLAARSVRVERLVAYRAVAATALPKHVHQALVAKRITGVVFYSVRTAEATIARLRDAGLAEIAPTIDAYCLSLNVAQVAGALPWKRIHVAPTPTHDAMLTMIAAN